MNEAKDAKQNLHGSKRHLPMQLPINYDRIVPIGSRSRKASDTLPPGHALDLALRSVSFIHC